MKEILISKWFKSLKIVALVGLICLVFITARVITSCCSLEAITFGSSKIYADTCLMLDKSEFRAWCSKENISHNLTNWMGTPFQEYETKEGFIRYGYAVEDTINCVSHVYILDLDIKKRSENKIDTLYNVCKRIVVKKED